MQLNIASNNEQIETFDVRLTEVVRLIRNLKVDVIALQGACTTNSLNPVDRLVDLMPGFSCAVRHGDMAIVSRTPLIASQVVALTGLGLPDDPNDRALLLGTLDAHGFTLAVANFSWVDEQAMGNAREALNVLSGQGDVLLVGDLNQVPGSAALTMLADAGFVDCWVRERPDDPGLTFEIGEPTARIDYVLERAETPLVGAVEIVGTDPSTAISNHAALVARIER